jgi:hypothetical protein
VKLKEHNNKKRADEIKNNKACSYYLSGIIAKNNIPREFVATPLTPFPNITAPMYSPGRIPAKPNTEA